MKKLLSITLTISIVFCFSACKKESNSSETSSTQTVVSSQVQSDNISSDTKSVKKVYPEKVVEVYSFENYFSMPKVEKKTFYDSVNGNTLPYRLFMPHNYDRTKKYPVILFLHGAGEIGTDNQRQLNNISKMFKYNGDLVAGSFLICPQSYEWWDLDNQSQNGRGTLSSALRLVEQVTNTYSCDSNRIYVTGLSMGGYATWDLLENYGYKFAAGIPVCGGGNSFNGSAFVDIPIRIFHGTADPTVNFSASQNMYNAIIGAGGQKVKFIQLNGVKHNAWDHAYSDRDTFSWLLAQNKKSNPNCNYELIPYLRIVDSKGTTIISEDDIYYISLSNDWEDGNYSVDFVLSSEGKNRLDKAYQMSNGRPFSFYCGTQKVYTFTATDSLTNDSFSVRGIFDKIDYQKFFDTVSQIISR